MMIMQIEYALSRIINENSIIILHYLKENISEQFNRICFTLPFSIDKRRNNEIMFINST